MQENILIEFIDYNVFRNFENYKNHYKMNNFFYLDSLGEMEDLFSLFNQDTLIYCEDDDSYIFYQLIKDSIHFVFSLPIHISCPYMEYFLEDCIKTIKFSFFNEGDEISVGYLKNNRSFSCFWSFNLNNFMIEEDQVSLNSFKIYTNNIFRILHRIGYLTEEFIRLNHMDFYDLDKNESMFYTDKEFRENSRARLQEYHTKYKNYIFKRTEREEILSNNKQKGIIIPSLPYE